MPQIDRVLRQRPEGSSEFPIYRISTLEAGKLFAEASMGFLGKVEYGKTARGIMVRTSTIDPVLATLGCQLAGWTVGDTMISGPLRILARKPSFIFDRLDIGEPPRLQSVACVEGDAPIDSVIGELKANGVESADILVTDQNSPAQFVNIPARAIEIALFRLFLLTDINKFRITRAISTVTAPMKTGDLSSELNDSIRFDGRVTLMGDFSGFHDFETLVTRNTPFSKKNFAEVIKSCGSIAKCPPELFSVSQLTVVDSGKTKSF